MSETTPTTPAPPTPPAVAPAKPRRRRMRWPFRIAIIFAFFLIAVVVLAQLIFWSDLPRQIVQSQIAGILRVDAKLGSLKIGWLGHVKVRDLVLRLPTEKEPFLTVDEADLKLAPLVLIAFDQEVRDLRAAGVRLDVRQTPGGLWNLQQLIATATPPRAPDPTAQPTSPARVLSMLPSVRIERTRVTVTRLDGKTLDLPDVGATLGQTGPLTTTFAAHVGPELSVSGKAVALGSVPHEASVTLTRPPPGLAAFLGTDELPAPIRARLNWTGRLTPAGLVGTLAIDDVTATLLNVAGKVDVDANNDGTLILRPVGLTLRADADPSPPPVGQAFLPVTGGTPPASSAPVPEDVGLRPTTDRNVGATEKTAPATRPAGPLVLTLDAGRIRVDERVRIERLRGTFGGSGGTSEYGKVAVDGTFDPVTLAGDLAAAWEDVARGALTTTGHLDVRTRPQFTGKLRLDLGAAATVRLPGGEATGTLVVDGEGAAIDDFDANLTIEPLAWTPTGEPAVRSPAFVGAIAGRGDAIELTSLRNVDAALGTLVARARLDKRTFNWWATLDADKLALPPLAAMGVKGPLDASVNLWGDKTVYVVQHLFAQLGPASAWARGAYRALDPKPLRLDTWAWYKHRAEADDDARITGLTAQGVIGGTIDPPNVDAALDVTARELVVRGRRIGDVDVRVDASVTAERAQLASREMELLGGRFALNAYRDFADEGLPYFATLDFRQIPVASLGELLQRPGLSGTVDEGRVNLIVPASLDLGGVEMTMTARGTALSAAAAPGLPPVTAETLTLAAAFNEGELRVAPVLRERGGSLDAELVADAKLERPIRLAFNLVDWPAPGAAATTRAATRARADEPAATRPVLFSRASAKGDATLFLRPKDGGVDATLTMNAGIDRGTSRLAEVSLAVAATDAVVTLDKAILTTLDGRLDASGVVDLRDLNATRLDATFKDLTPATLSWLDPIIGEVRGRFGGTLNVAPARGARPLGPLEVRLAVDATPDAGFRSVALGGVVPDDGQGPSWVPGTAASPRLDVTPLSPDAQTFVRARLFADVPGGGRYRFVTDRARIHVADGVVNPFGRYSYDSAVGPSQLLTVRFDRLDIDQITRVAIDDGKPIVGRLGGTARLYGPATSLDTINGEVVARISDSDLANFGPVAALYNLMNIGTAGRDATGAGDVSARIEGGTLTLVDATYFNRGVFANAFGDVRDLGAGDIAAARLNLTLVGTLQPLKQSGDRNIFQQVFGTANDALAALQGAATAVRATGTLKNLKIEQVGLSELGADIKSILIGKTK